MKLADLKQYLLNIVAQYKLEIYIDHIGVNFVIHKYIFPNASLAEMMNHVITDYSSENEGIIRQETQNDYTSDQMVEWAEQEHFEYEETKVDVGIELDSLWLWDLIQKWYIGWDNGTNIHALYYKIPHNGFSVTVKLRNNYDMHVMFDICSAQYKLEIYIDHIGVNFVIHKYIFPNASLAEMMNHVITDYSSENEGIIRQETQNDYTSDQMVEWAEQEHFEYEETKSPYTQNSHSISPISTMLSSTIETCLSYTHFFSPLTYYMAYGENEARQAIVLKLQREIQAEETLAQRKCISVRYK
ncbi:hypothetical protein Tco_0148822 [Tanacetum coccineum]